MKYYYFKENGFYFRKRINSGYLKDKPNGMIFRISIKKIAKQFYVILQNNTQESHLQIPTKNQQFKLIWILNSLFKSCKQYNYLPKKQYKIQTKKALQWVFYQTFLLKILQ